MLDVAHFRLRQKISFSFALLIVMILVNALLVGTVSLTMLKQIQHQQQLDQLAAEIDQLQLDFSRYLNSHVQASAQPVLQGIDSIRQRLQSAGHGLSPSQRQAMTPWVEDFELQFRAHMAALAPRPALPGANAGESEQPLFELLDQLQQTSLQASRRLDQSLQFQISLTLGLVGLIFLLTLASALLLSKALSREIFRPIWALVDVTKRITQGDLQARAKVQVHDEIGELASSFNQMTERLLATQTELRDKNQTLEHMQQLLEQRVRERTQQLEHANASLTTEIGERELAQRQVIDMHHALAERESLLRQIINVAPITVCLVDLKGCISLANSSMVEMFGYPAQRLLGMDYLALTDQVDQADREERLQAMRDVLEGKLALIERDRLFVRANGDAFWGHVKVKALMDTKGRTLGLVCVIVDISERRQSEEIVRQLAYYDPLTNLANRLLLRDRLTQAMLAGKRTGSYGALLFLDLDNFKPVNDLHGHDAGDLLLVEVAQRILACIREVDTVARFGGDEFVVLFENLSEDRVQAGHQAAVLAEKIRAALALPYQLTVNTGHGQAPQNVTHDCAASIGVVLFLGMAQSEEEVIKRADMAMYQAKAAGRNSIRFHPE